MPEAIITRDMETASQDGTFGGLYCPSMKCVSMERPPAGEHPFIPAGSYNCVLGVSPHFYEANVDYGYGRGAVYHVQNVPGREHILIHAANFASQLEGCIALGSAVGLLYDPNGSTRKGIMSSRAAVKAFMAAMDGKPFTLTIREAA